MPKFKWNDCSSSMISTTTRPEQEERILPKRITVPRKCISIGKASSSDRKWVDYSNSKIFIKKRPNHEYNILRQVLSRDKRLAETLRYEVKWTDYSQHFVHSPDYSPISSPTLPSSPSSMVGSPCLSEPPQSPPYSPPPSPPHKYVLSTSCPELDTHRIISLPSTLSASAHELSLAASISFNDSGFTTISHNPPNLIGFLPSSSSSYPSSVTSAVADSFYLEIQPLPIMEDEIYNYA